MDISEFHDTFFEEAGELLNDMEAQLLNLDLDQPDPEQLNAIFRAAHSIKGGAGTFGFDALQHTTHILENLLDYARKGELRLTREIVDIFLETKDMLDDQLNAYREGTQPDPDAMQRICAVLQRIAEEEVGQVSAPSATPAPAPEPEPVVEKQAPAATAGENLFRVAFLKVGEKDRELLIEELGHLGQVQDQGGDENRYEVTLASSESVEDIEAVMCFIAEPEQLEVSAMKADAPAPAKVEAPVAKTVADKSASKPVDKKPARASAGHGETSSIRVPVDKVDQIINLVGELIITQSMLNQVVDHGGSANNSNLVAGINLLERNARDLQEAVMSIRMVPMDYVFSRFPRLVRDLASKLDKDVELITVGRSTELDKSLTERIIDPLTHMVRNSLDHGIETPDAREAAGKPRTGVLTLSAEHQGGNIVIEVSDDGAGLNREKILEKAMERGLPVSTSMPDEEVWQMIFAPGFSTADKVSDVSGRGVGMDVVKRNIEAMGGHVEIVSETGKGSTTRIILPLTLAILDGMSIRVGEEMFILPVSAVVESLQPRKQDMNTMAGGDELLKVREDYLPMVALHQVMDVAHAKTQPTEAIAVIVQARGRRYALLVDELVGQQQVVVKNLETNYRKVPGVSAATILGDGSVALILDINDLFKLSRTRKLDASQCAPSRSTQASTEETTS